MTPNINKKYEELCSICSNEGIDIDFFIDEDEGVILHPLAEMPFDVNGMHATGFEAWLPDNGQWWNQYVDDSGDHYYFR